MRKGYISLCFMSLAIGRNINMNIIKDIYFHSEQYFKNSILTMCFSGYYSHSLIQEMARALIKNLEKKQINKETIFKVFSVFIEQLETVKDYYERNFRDYVNDNMNTFAIANLQDNSENFCIQIGYILQKTDFDKCVEFLESLKSLERHELRRMYMSGLRKSLSDENVLEQELSLIDMAIKCREPIKYSYEVLDQKYTFFSIEVWL